MTGIPITVNILNVGRICFYKGPKETSGNIKKRVRTGGLNRHRRSVDIQALFGISKQT